MLFNKPIHNWDEWGAIFQSAEAFTPLAKEIFCREGLAFSGLENLTPGTNAVFRAGDYVVKIFAPRESGMEPQLDYSDESAACGALTRWGISTPRLERLPISLRDEMAERAARLNLADTVLVHGDLTGENILIGVDNRPIIIDCADACLAPWWYELAPLVFELFHCREDLLRLFADTNPEVFAEQVMDAVCIHDFGANMLWDTAVRERIPCFSHLAEVRAFLMSRMCGRT